MTDPTWYLGPLGDLRAIECPEPGISTSEVRYGGVHQALSGARTMDVTGYRAEYQFEYTYLEAAEWNWLNALHTRHVPGPLRLLNPLKRNRLSQQASALTPTTTVGVGAQIPFATWRWDWDWPASADPGARSLRVTKVPAAPSPIRFDGLRPTAVRAGEQITCSVYLKASANPSASLAVDYYDRFGARVADDPWIPIVVGAGWQRFTVTKTIRAGVAAIVFAVLIGSTTVEMNLAAPQVEAGPVATGWEIGGGAPMVVVDQLSTSSPRFPYTDCSLTLLEA